MQKSEELPGRSGARVLGARPRAGCKALHLSVGLGDDKEFQGAVGELLSELREVG